MADESDRMTREAAPDDEAAGQRQAGWQTIAEALFGVEARSQLLRYASHAMVVGVGALAIWLAGASLRLPDRLLGPEMLIAATAAPAELAGLAPAPAAAFAPLSEIVLAQAGDIVRLAQIHTDRPSQARNTIQVYTVESGDTIFGIAQKYGLTPETIVWSNRIVLNDDPHSLQPGMEFNIPPINGVLYKVQEGDTLKGIAEGTFVTEADIIDWPGNQLDPDNPQIGVGQFLMVPGGTGKLYKWEPPVIRRESRNVVSQSDGAGACGGGYAGAVGTGYFVWPADAHYLSGSDFSSYHAGVDVAAGFGQAVYASDSGVVVWAGPNNYGYGLMVIIDHGNGWQTLYAHLSQWNVSCGQSILQGQVLGLAGSTGRSSGPHLHFEAAYNGARINPWSVLPSS